MALVTQPPLAGGTAPPAVSSAQLVGLQKRLNSANQAVGDAMNRLRAGLVQLSGDWPESSVEVKPTSFINTLGELEDQIAFSEAMGKALGELVDRFNYLAGKP